MFSRLSRAELVKLLELSHRCVAAESLGDLEVILTMLGSMTSFERSALCSVRDDQTPSLEHFLDHSFGPRWSVLYAQRRFDRIDPVLRHAGTASGPFRWGDAFGSAAPSRAGTAFLDAASDFGLVQGVAFACRSRSAPLNTILSLASHDERNFDRTIAVVSAIGPHIHEAYDRLRPPDLLGAAQVEGISLTPREREILAWTQDGKTYWEIGQIIGISQRTVKYHFERIKTKLDVVTVSHAVAKAMRLGLLD